MPDIATTSGLVQALALGFGLLVIIALRARRYRTDVAKSFIPLWLACCIGLGGYAAVEAGLDAVMIATRLPVIALLPTLGALVLRGLTKPSV